MPTASVRTRFAPSPTGWLHVGNARVALLNWLFAHAHGGTMLLRLDDTDTARGSAEYAEGIEHDLRWLGLEWDSFARQTDRLAEYAAAAERLKASGRLYPCFESEEELKAKREARIRRRLPPVYDRAALAMTPEQRAAAEAGGKHPYWRFRLSDGAVAWRDMVLGARHVKLGAVSDPVLIRADGSPLYTFTSVVDDLAFGITHVIRGEDHVTNTGVQLDILAALGGQPDAMRFAHLPLLLDDEGGKLSKRLESISLRRLRTDGMEPGAITAYLARLGTGAEPVPSSLAALADGFDLSRFAASAPRFDVAQLRVVNRRILQSLPFDAVATRLPVGATEAFWLAVRGNLDLLNEARGWWDVVAGTIVPPPVEDEGGYLRAAAELLPPEPWSPDVWQTWTAALKERTGRKGRTLFLPLRVALTGEEHGPDMNALLPLMGRARAAERLALAA